MAFRLLLTVSLLQCLLSNPLPGLSLYSSSVSLEVLDAHICAQRCADLCADPGCEVACRGQFCSEAEDSAVYVGVGIVCVVGVVSVACSVFFGGRQRQGRRKRGRRQEGDYIHL